MTDTLEGPEEEATKCQVDHFTILNTEICYIYLIFITGTYHCESICYIISDSKMASQLQLSFCVFKLYSWNVQYQSFCHSLNRIWSHFHRSISVTYVAVWYTASFILYQHWTISRLRHNRYVANFSHFSGKK